MQHYMRQSSKQIDEYDYMHSVYRHTAVLNWKTNKLADIKF
jgi:hypothetical protein